MEPMTAFPSPLSGTEFCAAPQTAIALFGMSGVGKTRLAQRLRQTENWFHYSIDYRIGTRYMGEYIVDDFKREAMKSPLLRELLLSDSIHINANITFENLKPLSRYLGKPGDVSKGGLPFEDYIARQRLHRDAELKSMRDCATFIQKAKEIYAYDHFLCDMSGSLVEVVDPNDPKDVTLCSLADKLTFVLIESTPADDEALARRFDLNPKPMYYNEAFLRSVWDSYLLEFNSAPDTVDPDDFIRWGFRRLLARRRESYRALADNWGVTLRREALGYLERLDPKTMEHAFMEQVADALELAGSSGC
jgi:hypothetical protein